MGKLIILISIIILTCILYKSYSNKKDAYANFDNEICRQSTSNNPFANYMVTSKLSNPLISACKNLNIGDHYRDNLYLNSKYAYNRYFFNKDYLDNNFITMPVTKNPNDLKKFGDFLYNKKNWLECKTDKFCLPWGDLRHNNRYINQ